MLLKAGCAVDIGAFDYLYRDMTTRCQRILVRGLKDRRDKLKRLALEKLPEHDIAALNLESVRTLDTQTAAVLGLLDLNGVQISPALRLTQTTKPATSTCYPGRSVYHTVKNIMNADVFWDHGFQDIDEFNGQFDDVRGDGLPPLANCENLRMIQWLVDHGANLSRELNHSGIGADRKSLRVTTAHFVFQYIGDWLPDMGDYDDPDWYILSSLQEVLPVDLFDNCECSCSKQGCTPFLMMLKALIAQESAREGQSIISIIEPFLNYLDMSLTELSKDEWKEAIRYFTFTTLEMSHTCHHEPGKYRYTCSVTVEEWQDTMHVRDEQADMIELLEGILFDLDAMIDTMMDDENQFDMSTFLTDHWLERMEAELEAISGRQLSEEYKKGTEALGVVWSEGEAEEDIDSEPTGDVVQYWLNAIDKAAGF
ncbi:hypothetical protein PFICI_00564 [Pestalotiopsis fici W106-1]|uniref:Uncharacterized protein n=1 Tax=Pestalotiopsis fici (strain W106-1 / CGMCC3.15140) TaxID=1229662 RepID=W3XNB5_PESFW|nr:uncharacterized protein PFICI_00564 [Pestalotiopsis fici W106-1]ETS86736.1 hypothetical protein PFICI_00564 [Pestalotiopsis fici W106-1]